MSDEENAVIQAAKKFERDSAQFVTMRQLGTRLGVSSHVVGRTLKETGLRDSEGRPSGRAKTGGFTKAVFVDETFPLNLWHEDKTLAILRSLIEQQQ